MTPILPSVTLNTSALPSASCACAPTGSAERKKFDLPLAPTGTDFQRRVWDSLGKIPWGETRSYRDIARAIGNTAAVRAVGAANGRNPLPIIVPCHRVIGSDGSLTGFAGGIEAKKTLLKLEGTL
jgi:methylated-DNA-[protein]-cysteine S-methyltransferase